MYLHTLNRFLISRGHKVRVMLTKSAWAKNYEFEGVEVFVKDNFYGSHIVDSDIVITHLDATFDTWRMVVRKPILWICHSGFDFPTVRTHREINVLYNGKAIVELTGYKNPYFILPPPIDIDRFNVNENPETNEFITLVNMNETKGGKVFWELAKRMPHKKFLGVKGYGPQMTGELPNVTVLENTPDMLEVYRKTRLILMPSRYESYGMVGLEAMCSGIPVLAHETFGLKENLGYAGIFLNRDKIDSWVEMINAMDNPETYQEASLKSRERAEEQRPDENLDLFEEHLHKLAGKKKQTHISKKQYELSTKHEYDR